jgi:orotidine 5'-phosphate decarboxylase subfamily 2
MPFNETLRARIRERKSMVCVGLDIDPARLPAPLKDKPDPLYRFLKGIIEATSDLVLAYKPNLAFYESLGVEGWDLLRRMLRLIPEGVIKIGDAKRGDIGSTAEKYASALFDLGFDAVTVNPYLGRDTVTPFVRDPEKGCFLLCLTSNPSSHDFQYLRAEGKCLYEHVAERAGVWNDSGNMGLVVGATHPRELSGLRRIGRIGGDQFEPRHPVRLLRGGLRRRGRHADVHAPGRDRGGPGEETGGPPEMIRRSGAEGRKTVIMRRKTAWP